MKKICHELHELCELGRWGMGLCQLLESAIADLANDYLLSEQEMEELVEHVLQPAGQWKLQGCSVHRSGLFPSHVGRQ